MRRRVLVVRRVSGASGESNIQSRSAPLGASDFALPFDAGQGRAEAASRRLFLARLKSGPSGSRPPKNYTEL
jgi:hypothetical protein